MEVQILKEVDMELGKVVSCVMCAEDKVIMRINVTIEIKVTIIMLLHLKVTTIQKICLLWIMYRVITIKILIIFGI